MKLVLLFSLLLVVILLARRFLNGNANYSSVTVNDLPQLEAEHPELVWIDVRTPGEIANGKIKGALEMNVQSANFKNQLAELPQDKVYVVYCRSGMRSARACRIMSEQGFEQLYNLKGGYLSWPK